MQTLLNVIIGVAFLVAIFALPLMLVRYANRYRTRAIKRYESWFDDNGIEAFRVRYPGAIENGRFTCPHCSGGRIFARGSDKGADAMEHICSMCGKTLYFSLSTT